MQRTSPQLFHQEIMSDFHSKIATHKIWQVKQWRIIKLILVKERSKVNSQIKVTQSYILVKEVKMIFLVGPIIPSPLIMQRKADLRVKLNLIRSRGGAGCPDHRSASQKEATSITQGLSTSKIEVLWFLNRSYLFQVTTVVVILELTATCTTTLISRT